MDSNIPQITDGKALINSARSALMGKKGESGAKSRRRALQLRDYLQILPPPGSPKFQFGLFTVVVSSSGIYERISPKVFVDTIERWK